MNTDPTMLSMSQGKPRVSFEATKFCNPHVPRTSSSQVLKYLSPEVPTLRSSHVPTFRSSHFLTIPELQVHF